MRKWHFFWLLCSRTHFSLKNFSKKNLLVVAHKQRFPSNSEPNWPSYLFPLSPSILPVPEKPWLLIWSTSHTPLLPELRAEIWPTKQAIFAMFPLPAPPPPHPPSTLISQSTCALLMKSPRVSTEKREQPLCTLYFMSLRQSLPNSCSVSCPFELSCTFS